MNLRTYWSLDPSFSTWGRWLPGHKHWFVGSGIVTRYALRDSAAQIIIPIEEIDELSDEQIGQGVRMLVRDARAIHALCLADDLLEHRGEIFKKYRDHNNYVIDVRDAIVGFADYPHLDPPGKIKKALRMVSDFIAHVDRKEKGKTTKRYERAAAAKDFDALFIAVGRRDGFKCAACGSVDDLQLDHIEPVALGGETHPNNLQLLCKPCNIQKGERTIDYRGTQQAEDVQ